MERQVFVSHAADDPDWPQEAIEAVASAIRDAGVVVRLDLWHERDMKRGLSLSEWRGWMDDAIRHSTHILCLVSPRYLRLWERRPEDAGGFGVAFESIRLIHTLYLLKQRNEGRIFTLRPEAHGFDCIPPDLVMDCTAYRWAADRAKVLSHVGEAALPGCGPTPVPPTPAPAVDTRPAWASDIGEDKYGRWADLTVNGATQRMRWIPPSGPGWLSMGARQTGKKQAGEKQAYLSRVAIADGFWLADTPCTQRFWQAVTGNNPSYFNKSADACERPVERVSWDDVMEQFIGRFADSPDWGIAEELCLPSEVEWEYSVHAGKDTAYWWGDAWDACYGNVWNQIGETTPVKRYPANPWGLFDMHGNVWEWCTDVWQQRRDASEARPYANLRVARGRSWFDDPNDAHGAFRWGVDRLSRDHCLGFRFALKSRRGLELRGN